MGMSVVDDLFKWWGVVMWLFDGEGMGVSVLNMVEDGVLWYWYLDGVFVWEFGLVFNGWVWWVGSGMLFGLINVILMFGDILLE